MLLYFHLSIVCIHSDIDAWEMPNQYKYRMPTFLKPSISSHIKKVMGKSMCSRLNVYMYKHKLEYFCMDSINMQASTTT